MYCIKCGAANGDDARFCNMCGYDMKGTEEITNKEEPKTETVVNSTASTNNSYNYAYSTQPKDYNQLGGWLAFFAYGHLVGAAILVINCITSLVSLFKILKLIGQYSRYYGAGSSISIVLASLLMLGLTGFSVYACLTASRMIRTRDSGILKFYEFWCAVNLGGFILTALFGGAVYIAYIISPILCLVLYEAYFRKSVRVSTYFTTDDYLKQSYLTKFWEAYKNKEFNIPTSFSKGYSRNITPERYCSSCGTPMLMSEKFCPKCGTINPDFKSELPKENNDVVEAKVEQ